MRVIVTGAARGIGAAICERVAAAASKDGSTAKLVISDLDGDHLEVLAGRIRSEYDAEVIACPGNIADPATPRELLDRVQAAFGGLDALFSNVGKSGRGALMDTSIEEWDQAFAINVKTPWRLACDAAPLLEKSQGSIVMTTSIGGTHPSAFGPYSVTKAAVVMLIKQLSVELGPRGIRVNGVAPSMVYTSATAAPYSKPEVVKRKNAAVPLRRISQPSEIAEVAYFLASPAASYITGIDMKVDGGFGNTLMYATQNSEDWK